MAQKQVRLGKKSERYLEHLGNGKRGHHNSNSAIVERALFCLCGQAERNEYLQAHAVCVRKLRARVKALEAKLLEVARRLGTQSKTLEYFVNKQTHAEPELGRPAGADRRDLDPECHQTAVDSADERRF